ncbi:MAG: DUF2177 family protein [Saprospiraceae bacterium]|jgi:uncharacterized membrane protein|nr:DUF2177 family protein [Saprospiraceae bacterium]
MSSKLIIGYLLTAIVFFAIDLVWLGVVAKGLYNKYLGNFLSDQVNWTAAIIFYLLFIVGIFIFAILPAVDKASLGKAILMGALFGFFTYATYDLTNLATLKGWPLTIVFIDIAWGSVLTGTVSAAGYTIMRWLNY